MNAFAKPLSVSANIRQDGLMDVVRGLRPYGSANAVNPYFMPSYLYETDGIAQVIVDRPAEDALSRGFTIEGDEDETVLNEMDRLDAVNHFTDAIRWARLEGASAVLLFARDGGRFTDPLNLANLKIIEDMTVYPVSMITAEPLRYNDPEQTNYGRPIMYRIAPERGNSFLVHESRLIKFRGDPATRQSLAGARVYWQGRSALTACQSDIERYRKSLRISMQIMERKQQAVHAMAGLSELLGTTEGQEVVRQKIALTDSVRGILNGITIDGGPGNGEGDGDKYNIIDLSLGGIKEVIGENRDALSLTARMPQTVLFGSDVKGLGSTGTGEQSIYHGLLKSWQERSVRPAMEELCGVIWAQSDVPVSEPQKWRLVFNPLWSPSDKEVADTEVSRANAKKISLDGVAVMAGTQLTSPEEGRLAISLICPELELDVSAVPVMPDDPASDTLAGGAA